MRYRTAVRLAIRLVGLLLLADALPELLRSVTFIWRELYIMSGQSDGWVRLYGYPAIWGVKVLIACYLIFGGSAVLNYMLPARHEYCPECGLNLTRSGRPPACPDCGATVSPRSDDN